MADERSVNEQDLKATRFRDIYLHEAAKMMVELKGVTKEFNARGVTIRALQGIDLRVPREAFFALVGPSGCGKSTVLNLIAGLIAPSHGAVIYDGKPVNGTNRSVGYMTQKDTLFPWRTVEDNIGIALELKCRALSRGERRDRVGKMIEFMGLKGFHRHYPAELSGGMRKRVALGRMLIYEPNTLLLDEPFGALDAQLKLIMQQELLRLTEERRMTVVFVTHDLTEAITVADSVAVFTGRPGRIRALRRVPLPRPRDVVNIRFTPEFRTLHEALWNELKDEMDKGTET
jgi:NitT/TauT family transport system ATP-binding protein